MAVPKIRFPGFTDAWEQRKLGEISERVRGNDGRMDLPTLTISAGNGWMNQEDRFSGNIAGTEQKNYTLLKKGQLSYNHGNSKLAKYGAVFELRTYEEALVPRVYHSFKTTNEADPAFIEYLFASKLPDIELSKLISSGARMNGLLNINYDQFMGISIKLPAVEEQIRIGQFFRNVDYAITLHQRKLESMKLLKKSLLQKMFPKSGETVPEVRFPGFTDAWEQRKLNEYLTVSTKKNTEDKYDKTDVLSVSGEVGVVNQIEFQGRSFAGASVSNYGVVETGDVVYTKSPLRANPYGIIKANKGKSGIVSTLYAVYKTIQGTANADFIECYFYLDDRLNMYLKPLVNIGAKHDMKVTDENALKGGVLFPSYEEQCQIADFFSRLDTLITLHQRKLETLQKMKKSLLQKMFV